MTTHVNKTIDWPLMNSIVAQGYKITDVENSKWRYKEPFIITIGIPNHRNGHFTQPNKVALKCCNPSLGLTTKARACKGAGQEGSPGVTSHAPRSVVKCEGMNPHTPKWTPTLRVGVLMNSWIFKEQLQGSKPIGLPSSLYHWKALKT
jgi:hypothetical protein